MRSRLGFTTSATFTDSKILGDSLAPWFEGNQVPRIPRIRLHGTISYAPDDRFSVATTMRFAMGSFVSLANTDFSHDSYGSTDSSYLVFDAKVQVQIRAGLDRDRRHQQHRQQQSFGQSQPYPERTFFLGVRYDFGGPQKQQTATSLGAPGSGLDLGDQSPTLHR